MDSKSYFLIGYRETGSNYEYCRGRWARSYEIELLWCMKIILWSLRAPTRWNYMKLGIDGYMRWEKERARGEGYKTGYDQGYKDGYSDCSNGTEQPSISDELLNHPIESLGLSVRAFNCLRRAQCLRVGDVVRLSAEQIDKLRNLGPKSASEIACALGNIGIPNTSWCRYIL